MCRKKPAPTRGIDQLSFKTQTFCPPQEKGGKGFEQAPLPPASSGGEPILAPPSVPSLQAPTPPRAIPHVRDALARQHSKVRCRRMLKPYRTSGLEWLP